MERLIGVAASPGIAIGLAHVLGSRVEIQERRIAADAVEGELRPTEIAELVRDVGRRSIRLGSELTGKVALAEEDSR